MLLHAEQFSQCPNVVRKARFHSRADAKGLVYTTPVVICEVKRTRRFQIRQFLGVSKGQTSKPFDRLTKGRDAHSQWSKVPLCRAVNEPAPPPPSKPNPNSRGDP